MGYTKLPPDTIDFQNPSSRFGLCHFELLFSGVPQISQTLQDIVIALGFSSELDVKTLFMKTPHEEIKLVPIWKLHLYWLVFIVLEMYCVCTLLGEKIIDGLTL